MKTGQAVSFTDSKGKRHQATVTEIAGTGASGYKALDLLQNGVVLVNVPHGDDREPGEGFWLLEGEEVPAPVARRKKRK